MARTIQVSAEIEVPRVPNFLRLTDGQTISIGDVTDESLKALGVAWTEELLRRAGERRSAKREDATPAAGRGEGR